MPAIGTALLSPAPAKKMYAKDDLDTVTADSSKPWFHNEKDAAEVFDEWAEEQWFNSPERKRKSMVAPHKDTNLNAHEFDEQTHPPDAEAYWKHFFG